MVLSFLIVLILLNTSKAVVFSGHCPQISSHSINSSKETMFTVMGKAPFSKDTKSFAFDDRVFQFCTIVLHFPRVRFSEHPFECPFAEGELTPSKVNPGVFNVPLVLTDPYRDKVFAGEIIEDLRFWFIGRFVIIWSCRQNEPGTLKHDEALLVLYGENHWPLHKDFPRVVSEVKSLFHENLTRAIQWEDLLGDPIFCIHNATCRKEVEFEEEVKEVSLFHGISSTVLVIIMVGVVLVLLILFNFGHKANIVYPQ